MCERLAFTLTVIFLNITNICFMVGGIYALQQGYFKTGGFLIAAAIIHLISEIKIDRQIKVINTYHNNQDLLCGFNALILRGWD